MPNPPENFTNVEGVGKEFVNVFDKRKDSFFKETDVHPTTKLKEMYGLTYKLTEDTIKSPGVQKLLRPEVKFDLVISELFLNDALLGFSNYYKCPHILLSTVGPNTWVNDFAGNPYVLSYIPSVFLSFTNRMNVVERLQNVLFFLAEKVMLKLYHDPFHRKLYDEAFPDPKPDFDHIKYHGVSLILLNSHFSLNYAQPLLPNMIEVAGMHVKKEADPLPSDIQKFLDGAKEGVVYFSMGSNLRPSKMAEAQKKAIINSLSNLKQKILWKWDDESILVDKKKILVKKWFAQDSVLAHPNVKLFVTHGGYLSLTESIYYGVPVVGKTILRLKSI